MEWIKIDLKDYRTLPPLGKKVLWCRTGEYNQKRFGKKNYKGYASLCIDDGDQYYADGYYITNDDYWFDIPELII